jgi:hypothetical protein
MFHFTQKVGHFGTFWDIAGRETALRPFRSGAYGLAGVLPLQRPIKEGGKEVLSGGR